MGVSYNDFISAVTNYYNAEAGIAPTSWGAGATWTEVSKTMGNVGINTDNYINYLENFPELFEITRNGDGTVLDASLKKYMYYGNVDGYNTNTGGALNSNKVPSAFADSTGLNVSGITTKATTGKLTVKGGIGLKADTGLTAQGVVSTIGTAALAVGVGAALGKVIGDGLYNANPDFWSTGKLSKLSETDWNKFAIAVKDDLGTLVNKGALALWGVDGDTTTMYVDENAVAYMAWYMAQNDFLASKFTPNEPTSNITYKKWKSDGSSTSYTINKNDIDINNMYKIHNYVRGGRDSHDVIFYSDMNRIKIEATGYEEPLNAVGVTTELTGIERNPYEISYRHQYKEIDYNLANYRGSVYGSVISGDSTEHPIGSEYNSTSSITNNEILSLSDYPDNKICITGPITDYSNNGNENLFLKNIDNSLIYYLLAKANGLGVTTTSYEDVTDNPNSTQFDPTGVGSVATALGALKKQYPDLWNNSIKRNTIQDDGSEDERTYVPIPIPKYNNPFDEQPTTGTPSQADPSVKPETTPKDELDNVSGTTTKDPTKSDDPNTGGGSSPDIIVPTQQASALWAIYNPTLSQLNSLGAWLWSSNFIDQLLKIFNDPMQAIIGLHKVYASPNISGSGNIKVGYLDSGVPSNIVGNQYTYIDCGTVSLREYYGNILDYSPYTTVQLYLPFIGIVSLDIADVSRSSITVKYGVDVLTGASLASVSVQRDNAGGVLYQYSGNCACQYPLSSGSYMGMVTGAIGAIGSLARGNIIGTGLSVTGMHTNIEHSGGFSGNAGAMGIKKPYLIISRPQSAMNDGFPSIQGYPSNYFTRLGDCSGFTQIAECHVENIPATDKELDKIKDLLKEGVIL